MSNDVRLICKTCHEKAEKDCNCTINEIGDCHHWDDCQMQLDFYYGNVQPLEEMPKLDVEEIIKWLQEHKDHGTIGIDIS